ncbi:MAG: hypothetical protein AABX31_05540 [Nanoarchaeota archaeon]
MKQVEYTTLLTTEDLIDVRLMWEKKGEITKFSLNYRAMISGKWIEIYRVDNYHGFLHEQRYWRNSEPIRLNEHLSLNLVIKKYVTEITLNYQRYRNYYLENMKNGRNEENEKKRRTEHKRTEKKSRRH